MKNLIFTYVLCFITSLSIAQNQWFQTYTDSIALANDANLISDAFLADVKNIKPDIQLSGKSIVDTSPYLIYYGQDKKVHLSFWEEVMPQLKGFLTEISGSEAEGKRIFGLFFNGFYLPHELGHGLQHNVDGTIEQSYKAEYFANTIAVLWWRKQGKLNELKDCYDFAKSVEFKFPNPVPEGQTIEEFFTKNYNEASQNPYTYGYMQFQQLIQIYEDNTLPDFDAYVINYLKQ